MGKRDRNRSRQAASRTTDGPSQPRSTADSGPPPQGELGTVLSWSDSLFLDYLDPSFGSISWWEAKDYQQMLRTESQARKVEQLLTLPLLSAPIEIKPGKGDKGECEWVTDALTRKANMGGMSTPLRMVIAQMTTAVTYRVASFEKVWGPAAGNRVMYEKLAFRPATNTRVIRDRKSGAYLGLQQDPPYGGIEPIKIPANRAFTYVHGQHRSPVLGSSDMEIPLVCWKAKQKLRFLWFLFLEVHAQPRTAFSDTRETPGDHEATKSAAKLFTQLRGGGAVALPPGVEGNVLETGGHAADLFQQALKYLDGEMTGQVLAQFADLAGAAADGKGSLALSRDQSDFYMLSRRYIADEMGEAATNWLVADLVRHNFGPDAACPTLGLGPLVTPDLGTMLDALQGFGKESVPAEFVAYLIEQTSIALGMKPDKVAEMVKAATAAHEKAAQTQRQEALAKVTGPLAGAGRAINDAARQDGDIRGRVRAAAAASA